MWGTCHYMSKSKSNTSCSWLNRHHLWRLLHDNWYLLKDIVRSLFGLWGTCHCMSQSNWREILLCRLNKVCHDFSTRLAYQLIFIKRRKSNVALSGCGGVVTACANWSEMILVEKYIIMISEHGYLSTDIDQNTNNK